MTKPAARPLEPTEVLTLLLDLTERLNSTLDLDALLEQVGEVVRLAIECEAFAIFLLSEKAQELRVRFSFGHPQKTVDLVRIKVGEGIVGRAVQMRRSVLVNDVRQDRAYIESLPTVRSELAVPLVVKNRVVGALDLEASWPDFFTEQHKHLIELLASRIAAAIDNAGLYRRSLRQARTLQLLNEISRELSSVLVLSELLRKIGTHTKRLIDYHWCSVLLANDPTRTFRAVITLKQDERMPDKTTVRFGEGIVGAAAEAQRTVVVGDVRQDPRYIEVNPDTRSELAVPLVYRERVIGVVDLESPQVGYFNEGHVRILSTLAPQIAIAIENARLYERVVRSEARLEKDLERAREIQRHLIPARPPAIPGLEVAARYQPARELGGDLYDFLTYGRDRHVLTIGDVSGKGAPAALYGAMVSGILRSLAPQRLPVSEMLRRLNVLLLERKIDGHFMTLLYAIWEPKVRTLHLANAGMPLPVLMRAGQARPIRVEGVPLGLLENTEYQENTLVLEKGDLLALFSDGLVEAMNPQQEEFGTARLESLLRAQAERPLPEVIDRVFSEVSRYEQGQATRDDQTLLMIRLR